MKQSEEGTKREMIINLLKSNENHWFSAREIKEVVAVRKDRFRHIIADLYDEEYIKKKSPSNVRKYMWDGYL